MTIQRELPIQKAIMRYLDLALPASYRAAHIPNGGARNARTAAMLKAMGVKAGIADIAIFGPGGCAAMIEVKAGKGSPSPAQKDWMDWASEHEFPYAVCRSIGDVQVALTDFGIPVRAGVSA